MTRGEAIEYLMDMEFNCNASYDKEALHLAIEALKQPERKQGKWIINDVAAYAVCSLCWHTELPQYDGVQPIPCLPPYCSMCGAKMEEEQ